MDEQQYLEQLRTPATFQEKLCNSIRAFTENTLFFFPVNCLSVVLSEKQLELSFLSPE